MESQAGPYLNKRAFMSPLGAARLMQLALGCAVGAMVTHSAGYSGSYGAFCMVAWWICFAVTILVFFLDATRLYSCLPVSWNKLTVYFATLATLMYATASVVYSFYFVGLECPYAGCEVRNFRIAVAMFSFATTLAYGAEVVLSRDKLTVSGILKAVQGFVACIIFGAVANGSEYTKHGATIYCVFVYAVCFAMTTVLVILRVCGRTPAVRCLPFDHFVVVYTFLAVLLYLSASVVWPVFCFDTKYGSPFRPSSCPPENCPWNSNLVVAVFSFINLGMYIADLIYSQRRHFISSYASPSTSVTQDTSLF